MGVVETFVFTVIFTVSVVLGLRIASDREGDLLHGFKLFGERLPEWLGKPLILCVTCMNSIWGTLCYALVIINQDMRGNATFGGSGIFDNIVFVVSSWPPAVLASAFITTFLWVSLNKLKK